MNIYRGRSHTEFYLASLLFDAVEDSDLTSVLILLKEKRADPNLVLPRTGVSSFHLAVGCGADHYNHDDSILSEENENGFDMQCTQAMLLYGSANPNVRSDEGLTPLHVAAAWDRKAIVLLLLRNGANPDLTDNCYRTAQMYAELEGHDETAQMLQTYVRHLEAAILRDRLEEPRASRKCEVILDKIIVNAGNEVAEYEVASATGPANHLDSLPITNVNHYVATWCEEHNQFNNSIITEDNTLPANVEDSDGGVGTSHDPSPLQHPFVTLRRPCNENRDILQPKTNSEVGSGLCKCSNMSRESGIMTLPEESLDSGRNTEIGKIDKVEDCCASDLLTDSLAQLNIDVLRSKQESVQTISSDSATSSLAATTPPPRETSSDYFTCQGSNDNTGNSNPMERNVFSISDSVPSLLSINNSDNSVINISDSVKNQSSGEASDRLGSVLNKGLISDDSGASGISAGSSRRSAATAQKRKDASAALSVQEVYKHTDDEHKVVLYEKRLLLPRQSILNQDDAHTVCSSSWSKLSSLPGSFDYDPDTLRKELTARGFEPGPITSTTKRVYLRKLYRLKKHPQSIVETVDRQRKYSIELERTLRHDDWSSTDLSVHLMKFRHLDEAVSVQFRAPDANRRWREGNNKSSFAYLLLDPRVTQNLPARADQMQFAQVWRTFISGIFYVGKGKRSRPYRHLYDALQHWTVPDTPPTTTTKTSVKLQRIVDIWRAGSGVICLHVFQNVIPVEAYCREAAMIAALGKDNITNLKVGEFYGVTAAWSCVEKRQFGVYLLYRAMQILLFEGERQLCPSDID